jgi:hypothetical protein
MTENEAGQLRVHADYDQNLSEALVIAESQAATNEES